MPSQPRRDWRYLLACSLLPHTSLALALLLTLLMLPPLLPLPLQLIPLLLTLKLPLPHRPVTPQRRRPHHWLLQHRLLQQYRWLLQHRLQPRLRSRHP
jgi:hypothetical protein